MQDHAKFVKLPAGAASFHVNHRVSVGDCQQTTHIPFRDGDAAFRRRVAGSRQMQENRRTRATAARRDIPVHDDDDVVERVRATHRFVARLER